MERRESERGGERMEARLYQAARTGNVNSLRQIIEIDELILDSIVVGCSNGSPLHVAASRGHADFVRELLGHNPELAEILDSQQRSPLHLAAAKGYLEIVQDLTRASPEMCVARDRQGANPLHVAAVRGNAVVLGELVQANPHAARVRVDGGETILHLCVKHNQLSTLQLLLEKIKDKEFVDAKDDRGNTTLHLAVANKNFEIIKHVLANSDVNVNATNASGHTAMDILFLARSTTKTVPIDLDRNIEDFLRKAKGKRAEELVQGEWLTKKRDALMVVAILIATIAFQAAVSPPGGVWQDNSNGHIAGEAVIAYNYRDSYPYFLRSNTIGFVGSLSTILLLISDLPFKRRAFMWILVVIMWLTITSTVVTYTFCITLVTPKWGRESLSNTIIVLGVIVWCSVMAILLIVHTGRLIANVIEERMSRNAAMERIFIFGYGRTLQRQPQPSPNPGYV